MSLSKVSIGSVLALASSLAVAATIDNQALWEQDPASDHLVLGGRLTTTASFHSDKPILIDQVLSLDVHPDTTLHLGGNIGNTPGVRSGIRKYGAGMLVLSGTNVYSGVTEVFQGDLRAGSSDALGDVATDLIMYGGTTLVYDPGVAIQRNLYFLADPGVPAEPPTGPYAHSLQWRVDSGMAAHYGYVHLPIASSIYKQGAGVLRLAGNGMGFNSDFVVEQGGLMVDGDFIARVQVHDGTWLQGVGRVDAAVIRRGGALWTPAGSPGLAVTHSLTFDPGSHFVVDVAAAGSGAPVTVGGQAMLAGSVLVRTDDIAAALWPASWEYPVLQAHGGFDGTVFDGVTVNAPFLTAGLRYDANNVYLQLGLDQQAQAAWPFSGSWAASISSGLTEDSRFVRQSALRHSAGPHTGPFLWADAFYSDAERSGYAGVPGDQRDLSGVVVGLQQSLGAFWRVNGYLGMQHGLLRRRDGAIDLAGIGGLPFQASASARVNSVHAGLSAAWNRDGMGVAVGAAHTWHSVRSNRSLTLGGLHDAPRANYRGRTTQVFGEVSMDALQLPSAHLTPFARLAWVQTHIPGYVEHGGPAALRFDAARQNVLFSTLGIRAEHVVDTKGGQARIHGTLAWRHAAGNITPRSRYAYANDAVSGAASGLAISRNAAELQLGVTAKVHKGISLSMGYAGQHARRYHDHGVSLGMRAVF